MLNSMCGGQKLHNCYDGSLLHLMTTKLEFVYFHGNKLSNFNGIKSLKWVKVGHQLQ
jgi:hypothetical protein